MTVSLSEVHTKLPPRCNFCTRRDVPVFELRSDDPDRNLRIVLCSHCILEIIAETYRGLHDMSQSST